METVVTLATVAYLSYRPLPTAPDGRYDSQVKPVTNPGDSNANHSALSRLVTAVESRLKRLMISDPRLRRRILARLAKDHDIDDRKVSLTGAMHIVGQLPQDSEIFRQLNDALIGVLYNTLPHPPSSFVGSDLSSVTMPSAPILPNQMQIANGHLTRLAPNFRSADGGGNNPLIPSLGQGGTPYARSVQSKHPLPANTLPDSGELFDSLLAAHDFVPHPNGNSSLTFAYASLVTHQLFRTDPRDMTKNNTSSYLDLSILYGINQDQQDMVRNKGAGAGLLWPDSFAEDRLVLVQPAASTLLVIFSRNHNYIARTLLSINERGRWTNPPPDDPVKRALQDEEIFQTARLVNCGHFMATIFGDYVAGFLGTNRDGDSRSMNPFDPIEKDDGTIVGRGEGNCCSVEFNLLYRWHAIIASDDIKWTESLFTDIFNGKPFNEIQLKDFFPAVGKAWAHVDPNPRARTFAGLKRQADGSFSDDDLSRILQDATEREAGAYRARGIPPVLRIIEMLCIEQARQWGVCTMNEFRKFLRLKTFKSFEEWNPDPEIAETARRLYGHIDNLELYAGLQAEDTVKNGLCCGYTMMRGILGDAISLVRGDRYYTTEYTPANLTSWGFQDCARDPNNGSFGAALPKLLFRHLPRHYPANSVYAHFPFSTPAATKKNLEHLGIVDQYLLTRPKPRPIPKVVDTLTGIRYVFSDPVKFNTTYGNDMRLLTGGYGFFLVFEEEERHEKDRSLVMHSLFPTQDSMATYTNFYKSKTLELIKSQSYQLHGVPGTRVDIVRNVINITCVHWATDYLIGLPLKTKENPKGLFTEQETYDIFILLFTCVFINVQPEHCWSLRTQAKQICDVVNRLIEKSINEVAPRSASNPIVGLIYAVWGLFSNPKNKTCYPFLSRLAASGRPVKELVANVIGLAVGSSVNYAQAVAQVVDFYLDEAQTIERADIISLSKKSDPASMERLRGYVREAQRLNPQFAGLTRVSTVADTIPLGNGKPPVSVEPGDVIFNSFRNAQTNPADFPDPYKVDPTRPRTIYQNQGAGFHGCPGVDFAEQTIPEILKIIFSLKNIRRAADPAGHMAGFTLSQLGTDSKMYLTDTGNVSTWPGSLTIVYDQ